nr:hypothetical protein [Bacillaceae bacterium]
MLALSFIMAPAGSERPKNGPRVVAVPASFFLRARPKGDPGRRRRPGPGARDCPGPLWTGRMRECFSPGKAGSRRFGLKRFLAILSQGIACQKRNRKDGPKC